MAIDTSIYNQMLQRPKTVQEYDAEAMQAQAAIQSRDMNTMKMDEYKRGVGEQNALRQTLMGFGADKAANQNMLYQGGHLKAAQDYGKSNADIAKVQGETEFKSLETAYKKVELMGQTFGYVKDNPTIENYNAAADRLVQLGIMPQEAANASKAAVLANPSLENIQALSTRAFQSALSMKDQLPKLDGFNAGGSYVQTSRSPITGLSTQTSSTPITQSADNAATQATSLQNNRNTVGATIRGQDMTDARSREANALGKVPAGYRANADGSLTFIQGGPADPAASNKAPTEFQGKSGTFGMRAERADKVLNDIGDGYSSAAINSKQSLGKTWLVGGALEAGANVMLSNKGQQVEQAQRDFVNAVLRQESGAAISDSEFENARKQYFAQPGDGAAVIAQKAANRKTSIEGFKNNAGRAGAAGQSGTPAGVPSDWTLQTDASGNKAYVSPDGKQFKEVK